MESETKFLERIANTLKANLKAINKLPLEESTELMNIRMNIIRRLNEIKTQVKPKTK